MINKCENCEKFYECDNTGYYSQCNERSNEMSEEYTKYEQAFGTGDVVEWQGFEYIIRECIQEEDDSWSYYVESAADYYPKLPYFAEVPQDELNAIS